MISVYVPDAWREGTKLLKLAHESNDRAKVYAAAQDLGLASAWLSVASLFARHAGDKLCEASAGLAEPPDEESGRIKEEEAR